MYVVLGGIGPKFKLIQAFMVPCKNDKDQSKMNSLLCSQHFSHYKPMGIFPDIQGQLTPQTLVHSCQISNPFKSI